MNAGNEVVAQIQLLQVWQQLDPLCAPEDVTLQPCIQLSVCNNWLYHTLVGEMQ